MTRIRLLPVTNAASVLVTLFSAKRQTWATDMGDPRSLSSASPLLVIGFQKLSDRYRPSAMRLLTDRGGSNGQNRVGNLTPPSGAYYVAVGLTVTLSKLAMVALQTTSEISCHGPLWAENSVLITWP